MENNKVIVKQEKGLHARIVAMIVHKASEINKKYDCELFITYKDRKKISATSLMPLVLLKVKKDEEIFIDALGNNSATAINDMISFLNSDFKMNDDNLNQVDTIIDNNNITWQQVVQSSANGIVAVDEKGNIIITNASADRTLNINYNQVVGKHISQVLPNSNLVQVLQSHRSQLGVKRLYNNKMLFINTTPIVVHNKLMGAVSFFDDISNFEKVKSELFEVKELKERLQLILETVHDGICVADKEGFITYVNQSYLSLSKDSSENLIGKNIFSLSPNGARAKVLNTGETLIGHITKKKNSSTLVANITPIIVDNEITGVVSVVKDLSEVENLREMLEEMGAKADYLEQELLRVRRPDEGFSKFIGLSGKTLDVLAIAKKAAKANSTVLIRGESGTGKEVIAEGIHYSSKNSNGPFVRVNCAAIPENLLESELFGHEKGAFTGAIRTKLGKFELANNGTIFLDEIGEMGKNMQAKILRVLQEKEFQRVGGDETITVNVRIIAATHRNLESMVTTGDFREDLYYRLNVIPISIPPLRERKQDLAFLIGYFLEKLSKTSSKDIDGVSNDAMELLLNYKWPGNVRELENLLERIVALTDKNYINLEDIPSYMRGDVSPLENTPSKVISNEVLKHSSIEDFIIKDEDILELKQYEKIIIEKALRKYGSYNAAAKVLGVTHKTVAAKARAYGIEKVVSWEKVSE